MTSPGPPVRLLVLLLASVIAILGPNATSGQRTPTISYISQFQIKDIGDRARFVCSVQYSQDYPVLWVKRNPETNDVLPISTNSVVILGDTRFRLDVDGSTYALEIFELQETDAGTYSCEILVSTSQLVSADVELLVRRPPIISDNSTRSVLVAEGQDVLLECYGGGFPLPRISWRRQNNGVLPGNKPIFRGSRLELRNVSMADRGVYYCVAENGVGRGARRNINLEVEFAPVVTVNRPRLGQALQYDMDLACHVDAYPPPAISWYKDDQPLTNNQHFAVSHFATTDDSTDTILRVITVEKKQYGDYVCRAANKLGQAEGKVELFETIIPSCPPACGH